MYMARNFNGNINEIWKMSYPYEIVSFDEGIHCYAVTLLIKKTSYTKEDIYSILVYSKKNNLEIGQIELESRSSPRVVFCGDQIMINKTTLPGGRGVLLSYDIKTMRSKDPDSYVIIQKPVAIIDDAIYLSRMPFGEGPRLFKIKAVDQGIEYLDYGVEVRPSPAYEDGKGNLLATFRENSGLPVIKKISIDTDAVSDLEWQLGDVDSLGLVACNCATYQLKGVTSEERVVYFNSEQPLWEYKFKRWRVFSFVVSNKKFTLVGGSEVSDKYNNDMLGLRALSNKDGSELWFKGRDVNYPGISDVSTFPIITDSHLICTCSLVKKGHRLLIINLTDGEIEYSESLSSYHRLEVFDNNKLVLRSKKRLRLMELPDK